MRRAGNKGSGEKGRCNKWREAWEEGRVERNGVGGSQMTNDGRNKGREKRKGGWEGGRRNEEEGKRKDEGEKERRGSEEEG
jgi:hypothetical protein